MRVGCVKEETSWGNNLCVVVGRGEQGLIEVVLAFYVLLQRREIKSPRFDQSDALVQGPPSGESLSTVNQ